MRRRHVQKVWSHHYGKREKKPTARKARRLSAVAVFHYLTDRHYAG